MASDVTAPAPGRSYGPLEPPVCWPAIFAGAVAALAMSILLTLSAAGFGLTLIPAGLATHSALATFTPMLGAGAVTVQVVSAGLGGYVAGRLRHQRLDAPADEAHFRDTAHGLIAWALSTIAGLVLASTVFVPYAEQMSALANVAATAPLSPAEAERATSITVQTAFFTAAGMLLGAFTAAVAARLGGLESETRPAPAARKG